MNDSTTTPACGPRYPEVEVQLTGEDGNGFLIMSRVGVALRDAGVPRDEVDKYRQEASASDYQNLLATTARWVTVR